jgi:hypothetical protein
MVYPLSHFQFFLTCYIISVSIFRNPFLIFYLDKQHPIALEKLSMSVELRFSSSPLPSCTSMGVWVHSRGVAYSTLLRMEHLQWMAWLDFPGLKVILGF